MVIVPKEGIEVDLVALLLQSSRPLINYLYLYDGCVSAGCLTKQNQKH